MGSGLPLTSLLLISGICFAVTIPIDPIPRFCEEHWSKFDYKCFRFFSEPMYWYDAEVFCKSINSNLASIHSREVTQFLRRLSKYTPSWVGGSARDDGQWTWTDRTAFDYTQWARGEPNGMNRRNCMEINNKGADWDDTECDQQSAFICMKNLPFVG